MKELLLNYLTLLYGLFQYDISVFSHKWLIITVVPAAFYLVFFFIKWAVLTAPIWMPLSIIVSGGLFFRRR